MSEIISKGTLQALEKELQNLKLKRKKIASDLARTASFGDLTENSEYQQAREEKTLLEKNIFEIEQRIKNSIVQKKKSLTSRASLYSKIKVEYKEETMEITLVPPEEINLSENKISVKSPLGKNFLGKQKGDIIEVETPAGGEKYRILEVR